MKEKILYKNAEKLHIFRSKECSQCSILLRSDETRMLGIEGMEASHDIPAKDYLVPKRPGTINYDK